MSGILELDGVSKLIRDNFGEGLQISTFQSVGTGQNARRHYVAKTVDGRAFGIKVPVGGATNEGVAGSIAQFLHAPNATRYCLDSGTSLPGFPQLSNASLVKIEWLRGETGNLSNASVREDIRRSGGVFFRQFGEWAALGLFLGINDRDNPGNWVWDKTNHRLQMIDLEYAFQGRHPEEYTRLLTKNEIGLADPARWRESQNYYPQGLMRGFLCMRHKLRSHIRIVSEYLTSIQMPERAAELVELLKIPDLEAFRPITRSVAGP